MQPDLTMSNLVNRKKMSNLVIPDLTLSFLVDGRGIEPQVAKQSPQITREPAILPACHPWGGELLPLLGLAVGGQRHGVVDTIQREVYLPFGVDNLAVIEILQGIAQAVNQ